MNNLPSQSGTSMSDLDHYSMQGEYNLPLQPQYPTADSVDFGFDPPSQTSDLSKMQQTYNPSRHSDALMFGSWSGFESSLSNDCVSPSKMNVSPTDSVPSYKHDQRLAQNIPDSSTAISRYGQVTPPRSDSANSMPDNKNLDFALSDTAAVGRPKRASKTALKEEASEATPASTSSGRKRKNSRKSVASAGSTETKGDDKRKQSLEKNRLAAAKCRVNKKEKTEQLQRDSHEKAVHNAFLKEQIMRMKEDVQQMNAVLLSHANCDGCKSPEEIQSHLSRLGNEFLAHPMSSLNYGDYSQMPISEMSQLDPDGMMQGHFFSPLSDSDTSMLNPPLPDFDRSGDFDVHTPMQIS